MLVFFSILRPLNLLQAMIAVILTTAFLGEWGQPETLILLVFSVITINGAGNIINDMIDIDIDRINRPGRPLPSGRMSLLTAKIYMIVLFIAGAFLAWLISFQTFSIAGLIAIPVLVAYSLWLKRLPLIGNIMVSFMLGLTFVYVGAAFGAISQTWIMAALAFGFTLIREIVKDLEDMEGDRQSGARTLPIVLGESKTVLYTIILIGLFVILDIIPVFLGPYSATYLWIVIVGINLPLIACAYFLWKFPGKKNYFRIQTFLKLNIFVGLAALYLGRLL